MKEEEYAVFGGIERWEGGGLPVEKKEDVVRSVGNLRGGRLPKIEVRVYTLAS